MSETGNRKCTRCTFTAPLSDWEVSQHGRKFNLCLKCREYHNNYCKSNLKTKMKNLEYQNWKYRTDEVFRNNILNKEVIYVLCDACRKDMRLSSLRPHLICYKGEMKPHLAMLKKLSDAL